MGRTILYWGDGDSYRKPCIEEYFKEETILYAKKRKAIGNRVLKRISYFFQDLFTLPRLLKCKIVYIPPMEYTFAKLRLSRLFRKFLITDVYAPIYDMTVNDEKIYSSKSFMARRYYNLDKYAITKSTKALFLTESERDYFCNVYKITKIDNTEILPLYIPSKPFAKLNYFNGKTDCLNLCWTGSYINLQGVDKIIDAAIELHKKSVKFNLFIIGPNTGKRDKWEKYVDERGASDFIHFPSIWGNIDNWINFIVDNCDITLGIFGESQKAKTVLANKVMEGVAYKTPVVTAKSSSINEFFKDNQLYVCDNEPVSICDTIFKVYNEEKDVLLKKVKNAYDVYIENFSKQAFMNRLEKIFG